MSDDGDIFNAEASKNSRDEAMGRADEHANAEWKENMRVCILDTASCKQIVTSDDISFLAQERKQWNGTHELRALGPLMKTAERNGWIRNTGRTVPSVRKNVNRNYITVWESLIFKGAAREQPCTNKFNLPSRLFKPRKGFL